MATRCIGRFLAVLLLASAAPVAAESPLVVIVHPSRDGSLTRAEVASIFLKKNRFWEDGEAIVPVNRQPASSERERFSKELLGGDSSHVAAYWNEQYFAGTFPPAVLSSADAVKTYVAGHRNAIGYIEASAVDASVRVVLRID